jgi:ATP-dependent helicase/nuclease subunit A
VHGAKGLQAPVVILADIAVDPFGGNKRNGGPELPGGIPMLSVNKASKVGELAAIAEAKDARELAEHNRLLYVALTRAEERLVLAGSLGKRGDDASENSWFKAIEAGMLAMGCDWQEEPVWGRAIRLVGGAGAVGALDKKAEKAKSEDSIVETPAWLFTAAPEESRPPRPLAPSRIDDDDYGDAPAQAKMRLAAQRGKLLHGLFERYDGSRAASFAYDAKGWLALRDRDGQHDHVKLIAQASAVLQEPHWANLFSASARAEVPLAALVGEIVVTGRIDRMLIGDDVVRIVDFKTGRSVPADASQVPAALLRQMAHYLAALEVIFPGKRIEVSLLYTHEPRMIALDAAALAAYKPEC